MAAIDSVFTDLASESEDPSVSQIESLCLSCRKTGTTKLLLTKIPHFKDLIISSFECRNCGHKNSSVQSGSVQEFGVRFQVKLLKAQDLSRLVVRSSHATLLIPEVDLEIPPNGETGEVTTVEGIVDRARERLLDGQEARKLADPELAEKIYDFADKLQSLTEFRQPFTLIVDDPSGNSFVENLKPTNPDHELTRTFYRRSEEQNNILGLQESIEETFQNEEDGEDEVENWKEEVMKFDTLCSSCSKPASTKMKLTDIPYFKEVIIMATECDSCGFKTNEVKKGGGVSDKGHKITLQIKGREDMSRDLLKSETCSVSIPELSLEVGAGILVGKFTTVEGLLTDIKTDLGGNAFLTGDSVTEEEKAKLESLLQDIQKIIDGTLDAHLILDDPAGGSYLQSYAPDEKDPFLEEEDYERSFEQNEDLGINDMKTDNYELS